MRLPKTDPSVEGTLLWPSLSGGSNWNSSTYSPKADLYYTNVKELAAIYHKGARSIRPARCSMGAATILSPCIMC
jgi:hypothetical protein